MSTTLISTALPESVCLGHNDASLDRLFREGLWRRATIVEIHLGDQFPENRTFPILAFLIAWYHNTSTAAWIDLAMHGSYGLESFAAIEKSSPSRSPIADCSNHTR